MARQRLVAPTNDVISDGGAVLWSFVKGEQLEFPVTINFITEASGYTYEAVVVEANNVDGQADPPTQALPGGVQTALNVRIPQLLPQPWQGTTQYTQGQVVSYNQKYYELQSGMNRANNVAPNLDPYWVETILNKVYIQFPSTLGQGWTVQPKVNSPSYGFFELRITEPANPVYQRTWKPVRGMVEILFSPTDEVPG